MAPAARGRAPRVRRGEGIGDVRRGDGKPPLQELRGTGGGCRCGTARDTWTGTLTVPGLDFDITPPSLTGAVSKILRAPRGAKRMRVRYRVTAEDEVDGAVPAICTPRSGSFFKLGRTRVTCSATDSSGNTRDARFTVTVRRARA